MAVAVGGSLTSTGHRLLTLAMCEIDQTDVVSECAKVEEEEMTTSIQAQWAYHKYWVKGHSQAHYNAIRLLQ